MNILFALFANTIPTLFVYNEVSIVEHNIIPTQPDPPTLARDLTLDAPATITQVAVDPDGLLVEHFLTVLIAEHRFVATGISIRHGMGIRRPPVDTSGSDPHPLLTIPLDDHRPTMLLCRPIVGSIPSVVLTGEELLVLLVVERVN